jgi:hypothetical protein
MKRSRSRIIFEIFPNNFKFKFGINFTNFGAFCDYSKVKVKTKDRRDEAERELRVQP